MKELASYLQKIGALKNPALVSAFELVERRDFLPEHLRNRAYEDTALPIGFGQTISQPYTVAFILELLAPRRGQKILDVGCGSGWQTALLSVAVGKNGRVFAIEKVEELLEKCKKNLSRYHSHNVNYILGNAWQKLDKPVSFDRIIVAAAAPAIPEALKSALAPGGRLVIPIGDVHGQDIVLLEKISETEFRQHNYPGFIFVPLVK